jgi:hypothetical protein
LVDLAIQVAPVNKNAAAAAHDGQLALLDLVPNGMLCNAQVLRCGGHIEKTRGGLWRFLDAIEGHLGNNPVGEVVKKMRKDAIGRWYQYVVSLRVARRPATALR